MNAHLIRLNLRKYIYVLELIFEWWRVYILGNIIEIVNTSVRVVQLSRLEQIVSFFACQDLPLIWSMESLFECYLIVNL